MYIKYIWFRGYYLIIMINTDTVVLPNPAGNPTGKVIPHASYSFMLQYLVQKKPRIVLINVN